MLYRTAVFDEQMIIRQAEQQARMLYKQILLTRQWASDHNGLFIMQRQGIESNPYLELPTVTDNMGNTYYMRNPAMITRELSQYSDRGGLGHFRVTSLQPINPANRPDSLEKKAMIRFQQDGLNEEIAVINTQQGRVVRFMAPLNVEKSCLGCHRQHGYEVGDIRGALSIAIPLQWADLLIQRNWKSLLIIGVISIILVTITLFLMFESLVVHRIATLSEAMDRFPQSGGQGSSLPSFYKDELDTLNAHFEDFCKRLVQSQEELEKAQKQAHLNEKMASLGVLTAGIAHEVNNPLGGMLNCVKSMQERPEDLELHQRYLPLIDKGLRQIETTMRQLLNFGRTEPLTPRKINLQNHIQQCIELFHYKLRDIDLMTDVTVEKHLMLDAEALKQIIINISLNAVQSMPDGGVLKISCSLEDNIVTLVFTDTGSGIIMEHMERIFDPFFTTKDVGEGTGLGLAVTYSLVRRMNGVIDVQSEVNKGTVFTVRIPVNES